MTERILRALGETDERYFLTYAENMKVKNPKKIILRRWLSAAAAIFLLFGGIFAYLQARYQIIPQVNLFRVDFLSFEEMMEAACRSPEGYHVNSSGIPYETRLSALDYNSFDNVSFYMCYEEPKKNDYSLAASSSWTYVCEGTKNGVLYEIVYVESGDLADLPNCFHPTSQYSRLLSVAGHRVSYSSFWNRSECAFVDGTGYYKVICHSNDLDNLFAILKDLIR